MRYGYEGENHLGQTDRPFEPLFRLRSRQVHRLLALRARLRRGAGHLRADRSTGAASPRRSAPARRATISSPANASAAAPACRPARPPRCRKRASRKSASPNARSSPPAPIAASAAPSAPRCAASSWCAWCRGRTARPIAATRCVKGRFAWGYANHKDRITKPMIRDSDRPAVARSQLGRGDRLRRRQDQRRSRQDYGAARARRHHLQPLHQRGDLPRPEAGPRRLRGEQRRYLRPRLPLADRLRPVDHLRHQRRHAGFRFGRWQTDVILVIGANPTDAHPVFASRMKQRLRQGAKLIVDRPAPHRPRAEPARRGGASPAAAAGHQRRRADQPWPTSS